MSSEHIKKGAALLGIIVSVTVIVNAVLAYDDRIDIKVAASTSQVHEAIQKTNNRIDQLIEIQRQQQIKSAVTELRRIEYNIRNEIATEYDLIRKDELQQMLNDLRKNDTSLVTSSTSDVAS